METVNLQSQDQCGIPNPLAPFHEKKDNIYGLKYAKTIGEEWFNGGLIQKGCRFMTRHNWVREMREFNRGESNISKDKNILARSIKDLDKMNVNWEKINVAKKFSNRLINALSDEHYTVDVRSADRFTVLEKKKKRVQHLKNMLAKDMLENAKENGMPDLTYQGFIPDDEEELNLWEQIKERPKQEIREEIWINYVKQTSDWSYITKESAKDLVECDLAVSQCYTDPLNGIQLEYVDIENYGHSYVNRKDFKDAFYHFVVDTITIGDIKRESQGKLTDAELRHIAKLYSGSGMNTFNSLTNNFYSVDMDVILKQRIHVMRFTFKTTKEEVWKKYHDKRNNIRKVAKRDTTYTVPEGHEQSRLSETYDVWMEGNYIVGSDYIYGYKQCERIARDEQNRALPPFISYSINIYKNKLRSFLEEIKPMCDVLQYIHLKRQHLLLELKPDLTVINLDQVAKLHSEIKGVKKEESLKEIMSILQVKGIIFEQTIDMGDEGGIQRGQGARPQPVQQGSAILVLNTLWDHYYNLIRDITGINPALDGSLSPEALVGVNEMMRLAGNTITKHYATTFIAFDKQICYTISSRIKGIYQVKNAVRLQKMYEQALGRHSIDLLDGVKDRHLNDFGFYIEMVPTQEELKELKDRLNISLNNGNIDDVELAETLRIAKTSMKQAHEYMSFVRKRRIKEKMKQDAYNQKLQSQNNIEAAQAKTQGEIQIYQFKREIDLQYEANLSGIRLKEKQTIQQLEAPENDKKFQQDVYMEQLKNLQVIKLAAFKEKAKDDRLKEQSTHQSKLIGQRQDKLPPFNFKNNFDLDSILDM